MGTKRGVKWNIYRSSSALWRCKSKTTPVYIIKFLKRVRVEGKCWVWTGCKNEDGYPKVRYCGKTEYAHRVAFVLFNGPIPRNMTIHHKTECLNPACVNPDHLELLTREDNTVEGNTRRIEKYEDIPL